jgi:hypothetical protein
MTATASGGEPTTTQTPSAQLPGCGIPSCTGTVQLSVFGAGSLWHSPSSRKSYVHTFPSSQSGSSGQPSAPAMQNAEIGVSKLAVK